MSVEIRVGLLGFGYAGRTFHAPLILATDGLRLTAVASSNPAAVREALGEQVVVTTPSELATHRDVDVVVIATPNDLHHPQALAALDAGRHVVVDKPMALNLSQAREMATLASERGRVLSVFHNRRWDGDFLTVASVIRSGRLGRLVEVVSNFDRFRPQVKGRWREADAPGAGLWLDLGPHMVDQALQLFGVPSAMRVDRAQLRDGALADDWFDAQLRWEQGPHSGLRMRLHASALAARPGERFVLHGTLGSLTIRGLDGQEQALKDGADRAAIRAAGWGRDQRAARLWTSDATDAQAENLPLQQGAYPAYYAALRDALRGQRPNPVTPAQATMVQAMLDAGLRSADDRSEVRLAPDGSALSSRSVVL